MSSPEFKEGVTYRNKQTGSVVRVVKATLDPMWGRYEYEVEQVSAPSIGSRWVLYFPTFDDWEPCDKIKQTPTGHCSCDGYTLLTAGCKCGGSVNCTCSAFDRHNFGCRCRASSAELNPWRGYSVSGD